MLHENYIKNLLIIHRDESYNSVFYLSKSLNRKYRSFGQNGISENNTIILGDPWCGKWDMMIELILLNSYRNTRYIIFHKGAKGRDYY